MARSPDVKWAESDSLAYTVVIRTQWGALEKPPQNRVLWGPPMDLTLNRSHANVLDWLVLGADMPLYMDTHRKVRGVTAAAVAEAHAKDLKVQGKHGVNYRSYWVDEKAETIFCLVEAPSAEAAARVHKEAHGLVADEIHEVRQG